MSTDPAIVWHDLECGGYRVDLALWRELAAGVNGPVLDVGAGTGRVAIELARGGTPVIALDHDAVLLAECARRAQGLPVETVLGDARALAIDAPMLELCLVPMQTMQLLDRDGRTSFLQAARQRIGAGGLLACALIDEVQPFDESVSVLPAADELQLADVTYSSQPTAVRALDDGVVLERRREIHGAREHSVEEDVTYLYGVTPRELERAGRAAGFRPERSRPVSATAQHVSATVVMLRG